MEKTHQYAGPPALPAETGAVITNLTSPFTGVSATGNTAETTSCLLSAGERFMLHWAQQQYQQQCRIHQENHNQSVKGAHQAVEEILSECRVKLTATQLAELKNICIEENSEQQRLAISFGYGESFKDGYLLNKLMKAMSTVYRSGKNQPNAAFDTWRDEELNFKLSVNTIHINNFSGTNSAHWEVLIDAIKSSLQHSDSYRGALMDSTALKVVLNRLEKLYVQSKPENMTVNDAIRVVAKIDALLVKEPLEQVD